MLILGVMSIEPVETYIVKDGDTGIKIADECGIEFEKLSEMNPGIDQGKLMPGNSLNILRTHVNGQPRHGLKTYIVKGEDVGIKIVGEYEYIFENHGRLGKSIPNEKLYRPDSESARSLKTVHPIQIHSHLIRPSFVPLLLTNPPLDVASFPLAKDERNVLLGIF